MGFLTGRRAARPERRATQFSPVPYPVLAPRSFAEVDLSIAEASLQSIAVLVTTDLIASLGSELPIVCYRGQDDDRVRVPLPSYLLDPAGDGHGVEDWLYQALMSWLLRGNLYGDILDRARGGHPTQVLLHHPDEVRGWLSEGQEVWSVNGEPVTDRSRWLHRRVHPVAGRVQGLSPIQFAATTIGLSITAARYGEQWFLDGAHPSALMTNDEAELDGDKAKVVKDRFVAALYGSREPLVLGKGWNYQAIQVTAEESQFLATQNWTEAQCSRIYGPGFAEILGYETGGSMRYTNVESRNAHLLVYSMNKWLKRAERLLSGMLPRPLYVEVDRDALLETTTVERYRAHALALSHRWKTVNEVRKRERLPRVAWGDQPNETGPIALPAGDEDKDGQ
ncbi:phage portal protein [Saccharothrix australiensis]|uniref:HK97 family phage portal protein n=1 Tax=Saccharothrix australiensis TaxID=2072 RepID=A0A495VLN0_9PSEU|nr:phage portal protein [Saccharothrix australiensis]RKT49353.1 HK97 family phage portal protein [Saccharothrix australiensis]